VKGPGREEEEKKRREDRREKTGWWPHSVVWEGEENTKGGPLPLQNREYIIYSYYGKKGCAESKPTGRRKEVQALRGKKKSRRFSSLLEREGGVLQALFDVRKRKRETACRPKVGFRGEKKGGLSANRILPSRLKKRGKRECATNTVGL